MLALFGLSGFVLGVLVMASYGYSVAFLTLVEEGKRSAPQSGTEKT